MSFLDLEAVTRFIDAVEKADKTAFDRVCYNQMNNHITSAEEKNAYALEALKSLSMEDIRAAALSLAVLIRTTENPRELLGIKNKPGPKGSRKLDQTIHSAEFGIVTAYVAKKIRFKEAITRLIEDFNVEETTAKQFIKNRKKAAIECVRIKQTIEQKIKK